LAVNIHDFAEAVRSGEIAVQTIEGAILGVDDYDGVDLAAQSARRGALGGAVGCDEFLVGAPTKRG